MEWTISLSFYKYFYLYEDIPRIVSEDPTLNPFSLKMSEQEKSIYIYTSRDLQILRDPEDRYLKGFPFICYM